MRATLQRRAFDREGWVFEHKLDGFRALIRRTCASVDVLSRSGRSFAAAFPEVVRAAEALPVGLVLDAELIVPGEHQFGSFEDTRRRAVMKRPSSIIGRERASRCDVRIRLSGVEGSRHPCAAAARRKAAIAPLLARIPCVQVVSFVGKHGIAAFAAAVEFGTDGIVAKRGDSPYQGRSIARLDQIKNPGFYRQAALGIRE